MPGFNYGGGVGGGRRGNPRKGPYNDPSDPESEQYRKLFIGGLSYETTDDGLKEHFEKWGEIEDHIVMKDPQTKRSRGFGFVTYKQASSLDDAQACRPHVLDGRTVETKRAMPREDSDKPEVHSTATKMFIGGMKDDTTEEQIREVFEELGTITKVDLPVDKSGKQRSYAFVEFEDYDNVDKCVLKREFMLNGKKVEVKKAKPKQEAAGGGGGRGGGRSAQTGRGGGQRNYGGSGGYGGGFGAQGGYQGYGGGYGGGYDDGNYGGGYNQGSGFNQSGYGDNFGGGGGFGGQGSGNWSGFGQGYGGYSGGGPMKGQYGGGNQRGGQPYQSGFGRGGFNR